MKRLSIFLLLMAMLLPGGGMVGQAAAPPGDTFYNPPIDLHDAAPGEILRIETFQSEFDNARTWRMLYVSTASDGEHVAVSGLLVVPATPAPEDGYPLVAVGHGSVGIGQKCAPSMDPYASSLGSPSSYDLFVAPLVDAGYVVVMSDYRGLGVAGPSSYLVGELEGRDILDSARAAFAVPDLDLQPDVLIWGHSQGGHAALFAAQMASDYAPELLVGGVVAEAPVVDLEAMYSELIETNARGGIVSLSLMTIDGWVHEYPEIRLDSVLTTRGQEVLRDVVRPSCLTAVYFLTQFYRPSALIQPGALSRLEPYVVANTPQHGPYGMPVLMVQGEADDRVPVAASRTFVARMCDEGTNVTYRTYGETGHNEVIDASLPDVLSWMRDIRDGAIPSGTCD